MLENYLKNICDTASKGDATEESFYPCLLNLLIEFTEKNNKRFSITPLPKRTEAGNPDFRVWDGKQSITGYIEAKKPEEDLIRIEKSEQIKRYRGVFPNLILTNFFEFRLYRDGELVDTVQIASPSILNNYPLKPFPKIENAELFYGLINKFLSFSLPQTHKAKDLAHELAKRTQFLKEIIYDELKETAHIPHESVHEFYEVFKKYLIGDLTEKDFADLYSQTITYGLFAARTRSHNGFNRKLAYDHIPKSVGILRDVFRFISIGELPKQMEWIIDDISEVLAVTDVFKILDEYFHQHKGSDPIVHFYETFLAEYDPKTRERRGVYYTPEPVVLYIVQSIHEILKTYFEKGDGFASDDITVLDPSAGTLTFMAESSKLAVSEFASKYGEGGKESFIKEHILKNFYAFELMMAPYAIGHLKISFLLEELGYKLSDEDRFKLYLTNTLEMEELEQTHLPGMSSLSEESRLASEVKKQKPILVVLGNPPYSGHSANTGEWISKEVRAYYQVDGKPLKERNPKWLQDDYVKFIRFAQWKIEQLGEGVLGFITNHSYIDNPTFRGMRQSLMNTFDEIYILNLHGNSKKKEKSPDGSKDVNVFDIQQGVAISIFIKKPGLKKKIQYSEIWGSRETKYEWLKNNSISTTRWKRLHPKSEYYLFIPRNEQLLKEYETFPKITDIFKLNSVGIVTARDDFTIHWTKEAVWNTVLRFTKLDVETARREFNLGEDVRDWKVELAQKDLIGSGLDKNKIVPILYRPFDIRYTYYTGNSRGFHCRPRPEVMKHILNENLGLITIRRSRSTDLWNFAFITDKIISGATAISSLDINYLFPLYVYENHSSQQKRKSKKTYSFGTTWLLFEPEEEYSVRKPNISESFMEELKQKYKKVISPEEILYYIYAVLYSTDYRSKYAEFLKLDFPRIPFANNYSIFKKMAGLGERLVLLHLLKDYNVPSPVRFQGKGNNKIDNVEYRDKKVYINKEQCFDGIDKPIWEYKIGGYQVLEKWLRDRKDRELQLYEIKQYCQMYGVLKETIGIQKDIDKIFSNVDK